MRIVGTVLVALLVLGVLGLSRTDDCSCVVSAGNRLEALRECAGGAEDDPLLAQTEGMEWQCEYWYECTRYGMRECDPCFSICMAGCIAGGAGSSGWSGVGAAYLCAAICERCPDCEVCIRWVRRRSCGWVLTE